MSTFPLPGKLWKVKLDSDPSYLKANFEGRLIWRPSKLFPLDNCSIYLQIKGR
jgi:hypothetical protein